MVSRFRLLALRLCCQLEIHHLGEGMDRNFPRLLDTLRLVPSKRHASTEDIHRHLTALGHGISRRTVERDLLALAATYDIECDDRSRPYGWRWRPGSHPPLTPNLDLHQALGLTLMERELGSSLPRVVREALEPWFEEGRKRLAAQGEARAARWNRKLAFRSLGPPLLRAVEPPGILETLNEALFTEHPVEAEYRRFNTDGYRKVVLHPLGLVRTGLVTYLVVCFDGYSDPRIVSLHRLRRVKLIADKELKPPPTFNLEQFLDEGALDFGSTGLVNLRLRMHRAAASHLYDTPLSRDQVITPQQGGEWVIVEATVKDSDRLLWWIRGFGDLVERLPDGQIGPLLEAESPGK